MSDTVPQAFEDWALLLLGDNPAWRNSADCELAWQAWQAAIESQAPAPTASLEDVPFLIYYDDADAKPEIVIGETTAREAFARRSDSWNAHLFVKVASNSRDGPHAAKNAVLASQPPAAIAEPASPAVSGSALNAPVGQLGRFEMFDYPDGCSRPAWIPEPASPAVVEALQIARAWLVENHDQVASGAAWKRYSADLATIDAALASRPAAEPPSTQPHLSPKAMWPFPAKGPKA